MPKLIAKLLPPFLKKPLEFWYHRIHYFGTQRYCPACKSSIKHFLAYGETQTRQEAKCPVCGLLERHRASFLLLPREIKTLGLKQPKILHFAPEVRLETFFKSIAGPNYLSADLSNEHATVNFDIMDIPYPENSFNFIYCSHVLEHVPDDIQALKEMRRVLTQNGKAFLMVPVLQEQTFEDRSIVDPKERERVYGQYDHVRIYGKDFPDRVTEAGFTCKEYRFSDYLSDEQIIKYGLSKVSPSSHAIYICSK